MGEQIELDHSVWLQGTVLENIVIGTSLPNTLDLLCELVEQITPGAVCSVMLVNDDGCSLSVGAGPSLGNEVRECLNGLIIGANAGSCGTAAYTGEPVIAEDTTIDARWADLQLAVDQFNIRACWSYPIRAIGAGETLGTFAISHGQPTRFEEHHRQVLESASHLAGIAIQLSRLQHAQSKAVREAQELELAMQNAIPAIARLDRNDCYVMVRERYAEILGYTPDEMLGMHVSKTIHPDDMPLSMKNFERLYTDGRAQSEVRGIRKDGTSFDKRCLLVATHDEDGKPNGYYCFMDDLTERKRAQRENEQLEEQLRQSQKLDAVGTLASGIAHDFNNLLTAINGYAEIARDSLPIGHPARRSMQMLESATEQASGVTRSLLTFSHRAQFEKERIDLAVVINDSIQLLRHLLPASIELVHEIEAVPPVWVNVDATQIQQVLMNLAINARDALENGGQVEIRLLVKHPGDICRATDRLFEREEAVIVVRDTGMGMTPETVSRVFEPFFTTKQRGKGTGLGLSVVHGIVTEHDGMIGVESQPGMGTTFIVCLPTCESTASSDASKTKTPRVKPNGEMILLAEDNIHVGNLMVEALESAGYNPVLARDGDEAMNLFRGQGGNARLVVLDIDLPKRSGLNCADEIRQANSDLPVVIVTGNVQQLNGRKLGDNEQLLAKPFRPSELIRVVNECLGSN